MVGFKIGSKKIFAFFLIFLASSISAQSFSVPIWDSTAEWEVTWVAASKMIGHLGGPAREAGYNVIPMCAGGTTGAIGNGYINGAGGKYYFGWYDFDTKRAHAVAGSGIGCLDGPFGRARFGSWGYNFTPISTRSTDGRYLFFNDEWSGVRYLRLLDFREQVVKTLVSGIISSNTPALAYGSDSNVYMLTTKSIGSSTTGFKTPCSLMVYTSNGSVVKKMMLDTLVGKMAGITRLLPMALDDVNNRLYCGQPITGWYVYYWDLADGSFHGVIPISDSLRSRNAPGPFEGTNIYGESGVLTFGPDDPEKRFLYYTHVDTKQLHRIDLQERMIAAMKQTTGTDGKKTVKFSYTTYTDVNVYVAFMWVRNGYDFTSGLHSPHQQYLYTRIK